MNGRKILIGITGSIAAYKIPQLVRLLIKAGAEVKVLMTPSAINFVSPLVLSTLSKNRVLVDIANGTDWENHVMLGRWADLFLIAPASCNSISKMANGLCDNLVMAVYLSATCPVMVAPAMDEDMWHHASTKRNLALLRSYGNHVLDSEYGELASGLIGMGRMMEPEQLISSIDSVLSKSKRLSGKKALVSAGPTYENLDPVRFIGNYSSGKMGIAIAEALANEGCQVELVLGPVALAPQNLAIHVTPVRSAQDMYEACMSYFADADITVMAAAVADYTPVDVSDAKIKKQASEFELKLKKTTDILKSLGAIKKNHQILVGFALENRDEKQYALKKLQEKNADAIVMNSLRDEGAGFAGDTNKITIFEKDGTETCYELKSKMAAAKDIVEKIIAWKK